MKNGICETDMLYEYSRKPGNRREQWVNQDSGRLHRMDGPAYVVYCSAFPDEVLDEMWVHDGCALPQGPINEFLEGSDICWPLSPDEQLLFWLKFTDYIR